QTVEMEEGGVQFAPQLSGIRLGDLKERELPDRTKERGARESNPHTCSLVGQGQPLQPRFPLRLRKDVTRPHRSTLPTSRPGISFFVFVIIVSMLAFAVMEV